MLWPQWTLAEDICDLSFSELSNMEWYEIKDSGDPLLGRSFRIMLNQAAKNLYQYTPHSDIIYVLKLNQFSKEDIEKMRWQDASIELISIGDSTCLDDINYYSFGTPRNHSRTSKKHIYERCGACHSRVSWQELPLFVDTYLPKNGHRVITKVSIRITENGVYFESKKLNQCKYSSC